MRLLHGALALVNPLAWDEPFGLVMAEAMACGVPVIATPRGSVPEIVIPGQTGWIAETVEEMAAAVGRCREIDPSECRAIAELSYSPERMVADYVEAFHAVVQDARSASPLTRHARLGAVATAESTISRFRTAAERGEGAVFP